jgi:hypothetical protein
VSPVGGSPVRCYRAVDATDPRVDILVCEPYGLADDEIAIVEAATAR